MTRLLERHVFNPVIRVALLLGVAPRAFALLETRGRRSGRIRRTPVGNGLTGAVFWLIAAHGERGAYVQNLLAEPRVRVRVGRRWYAGSASLVPGDDALGRRRGIDAGNGVIGRLDGIIFRATASAPVTFRIDLDPPA
jgi:deazaflavin-dependent oxidoreductase (nitroreductase family)